jgi:hypothetical protein
MGPGREAATLTPSFLSSAAQVALAPSPTHSRWWALASSPLRWQALLAAELPLTLLSELEPRQLQQAVRQQVWLASNNRAAAGTRAVTGIAHVFKLLWCLGSIDRGGLVLS